MENKDFRLKGIFILSKPLQFVIFISTVILLSNLNAIVDSIYHPEIPYFDEEHLIVGGVIGLISALLFGVILLYMRHLEQSLSKIKILESFLPICSNYKKNTNLRFRSE